MNILPFLIGLAGIVMLMIYGFNLGNFSEEIMPTGHGLLYIPFLMLTVAGFIDQFFKQSSVRKITKVVNITAIILIPLYIWGFTQGVFQ